MAKATTPEAELEKKNGVLRAQYIRQSCYAWLEKQRPTVLAKIQELALKKYPKHGTDKAEFVLDDSLANLK